MVQILPAIIVLVVLYLVLGFIFKISKLIVVIVLLVLVISFFLFGYRDTAELQDLPKDTTEVIDNITITTGDNITKLNTSIDLNSSENIEIT
jgi:hypothetical protein